MAKFMEHHCLEQEGILRIPGSASRIKVKAFPGDQKLPRNLGHSLSIFTKTSSGVDVKKGTIMVFEFYVSATT